MKILKDVLKKNRLALILCAVLLLLNAAVVVLYNIMTEAFIYSFLITIFFLVILLSADYRKERKAANDRQMALASILSDWKDLPDAHSLSEKDYGDMIAVLGRELERVCSETDSEKQDMLDYYTTWVHQIKTPIAVMKLKLSKDTPENRALSSELFRIEQYVDMVLQYIRIGSSSNDLVIREYALDDLIKESVRKYAGQFVEKRLKLAYERTDEKVVTDKKWFLCILDQLVSNAIKYTPKGEVRISVEASILKIEDTGIGISSEDLPRIFEKGYTGTNGRIEKKASGLGFYLAKKAADMLSIPLYAESTPGAGSTFLLDLRK